MMNAKPSCQIVTDVLARQGVRDAVVSPGSRNAPLLLALDGERLINKHVVIDERSAAFIALGMAQASHRPVVLCCTSGTALLNYAPAIAEAYYQNIPLIILSADRPAEWIDQDDSQTLRQFEALRNYVKDSFDIPDFEAENKEMCWFANRTANDAFISSISGRPGPVHINMHFSAPLTIQHGRISDQRIISTTDTSSSLPPRVIKHLAEEAAGKRVLVVAGQYRPSNRINRAVTVLSHMPNVAIWAESIANIHTPDIVDCIDRTLTGIDDNSEEYNPELIISFGGALVSRKGKEFLRKQRQCDHWSIGYRRDRLADPFMHLTRVIETSPEVFMSHFAYALCRCHPNGKYAAIWSEAAEEAAKRHAVKVETSPWSALRAFHIILSNIPPKVNLQLSNGTPIRYAQLFDCKHIHASYCNRGVSGIDGSTSTAIGASSAYAHPTLLISGDMSFAYDIGALATTFIPSDFKAIIINNSGGEIFRFIPTTSTLPSREHYFSVPPVLPLKRLAVAYGFDYYFADSEKALRSALSQFFTPGLSPSIMEVAVPPDVSARTLTDYFKQQNINNIWKTGLQ